MWPAYVCANDWAVTWFVVLNAIHSDMYLKQHTFHTTLWTCMCVWVCTVGFLDYTDFSSTICCRSWLWLWLHMLGRVKKLPKPLKGTSTVRESLFSVVLVQFVIFVIRDTDGCAGGPKPRYTTHTEFEPAHCFCCMSPLLLLFEFPKMGKPLIDQVFQFFVPLIRCYWNREWWTRKYTFSHF